MNGKKEFNIVERFKSGKRGWDLHDLDGHSKEIRLSSRLGCVKAGNSIYRGDWIKEGNLVMTTTHLDPMGKLFLGEVDVFTIYNKDIVRKWRKKTGCAQHNIVQLWRSCGILLLSTFSVQKLFCDMCEP